MFKFPDNFAWHIGVVALAVSCCMLFITPLFGSKPTEIESLIVMCTGLICMAIGDHK
jgi:hypothetical protein